MYLRASVQDSCISDKNMIKIFAASLDANLWDFSFSGAYADVKLADSWCSSGCEVGNGSSCLLGTKSVAFSDVMHDDVGVYETKVLEHSMTFTEASPELGALRAARSSVIGSGSGKQTFCGDHAFTRWTTTEVAEWLSKEGLTELLQAQ